MSTIISLITYTTSMTNLADISEPQVPPNGRKDQYIQFSICLNSVSMGRIAFLPLKPA